MRVLADTHALVWAVDNPDLLSSAATHAFENDEVVASVAALWELCVKSETRSAPVADPVRWWRKYVAGNGIVILPIRAADVIALCSLPQIHKDPFDRILIAQSMSERIPIITRDGNLALYGVPTIW